MSLGRLDALRFRNLTDVTLELSPGINLLFGENGSGKTSLLESSYFLSSARSFRSAGLDSVIQRGQEDCLVRGNVRCAGQGYQIGIKRDRQGARDIRINGEIAYRATDLARLLPTLLLGPESVDLLIGPPIHRRRFLNWGLFHVEQGFTELWDEANRCLRQRNLVLRANPVNWRELEAWSIQLAELAGKIDRLREAYCKRYREHFAGLVPGLTGFDEVEFEYQRGWPKGVELLDIYQRERDIDQKRGYTQKGFHRADVRITVAGQAAVKVCSRGELKALVWGMKLAQGALGGDQEMQQDTLYLVDDLASEFDQQHRRRLCKFLSRTGQQVLLTGIDRGVLIEACEDAINGQFHVKHGEVQES